MKTPTLWTIWGVASLGLFDISSALTTPAAAVVSGTPKPKDDYSSFPFAGKPGDYGNYPGLPFGPLSGFPTGPPAGSPFGSPSGAPAPPYNFPDIVIEIDEGSLDNNGADGSPKDLTKDIEAFQKAFQAAYPDGFDFKTAFPDGFQSPPADDFDFKSIFPDDFDFDSYFPDGFDFNGIFPPSGTYGDGYNSPSPTPTPSPKLSPKPAKTTLVTVTRAAAAPYSGSYVYEYPAYTKGSY